MENMVNLLIRESASVSTTEEVPSVDPLRHDLANRAAKLFGYTTLKMELEVADAFAELEISPYSIASVERYKAAMLKKIGEEECSRVWARRLTWGFGSIFALTMLYVGGLTAIHELTVPIDRRLPWVLFGSYTIAAGCYLFTGWKRSRPRRIWNWRRVSFDRYYKDSLVHAEFAVDTAVRLRERLPKAKFYIEELACEMHTADPFLVMEYGAESYYLEVWGEKEFERQNCRQS